MNKAIFFLIGLLSIFLTVVYLDNSLLKKDIASINKALAHRERIAYIWSYRYDFLRYQLSHTNIRVSLLEKEVEDSKNSQDIQWILSPGGG